MKQNGYTGCPTTYQTRHFFNNSNTNEDIATKFEQEYVLCVRNEEKNVIQLLVLQLSPFPCYLVPLRSKYFSQHPVLKHPQSAFLPQCQRPGFTPIQNHGQNYSSIYRHFSLKRILARLLSLALQFSVFPFPVA